MGGSATEVRRDGETKAEMYERFGQGAKVPDEPETPDCVEHVLKWFFELSNRRQPSFGGIAPLTFEGIDAWARLMETMPTPEEIEIILRMDSAFRAAVSSKAGSEDKKDDAPTQRFLRK